MRIEIMPTMRCNLSCKGCDRGTNYGPALTDDLSTFDIIKEVFDKTSLIVKVEGFTISGGEPALYKKLTDLITFTKTLVDVPVDIKTNGTTLLDRVPIEFIKTNSWGVSIYQWSLEQVLPVHSKLTALSQQGHIYFMRMFGAFDDMRLIDRNRRLNFDPRNCFMPTIIGDIKRVFPCCRARTFELLYDRPNVYSLSVEDYTVDGLFNLITNTDMCSNCPRCYASKTVTPDLKV